MSTAVPDFHVSLDQFSGPLDLLLHLVRTNEMDLVDLDLALITDEYMLFIESNGVTDLGHAYSFLAMAATLVEWKSRLLLPEPQARNSEDRELVEEDPRETLIRQLTAFQSIQETTEELARLYALVGRHWPRQAVEQLEAEIVYALDSLSSYDLMKAFEEVLSRPRFHQISIFKEDYDIVQGREWLGQRLAAGPQQLKELLLAQPDLQSLIVTFIALLEMIREEQVGFEIQAGQPVLALLSGGRPGGI